MNNQCKEKVLIDFDAISVELADILQQFGLVGSVHIRYAYGCMFCRFIMLWLCPMCKVSGVFSCRTEAPADGKDI